MPLVKLKAKRFRERKRLHKILLLVPLSRRFLHFILFLFAAHTARSSQQEVKTVGDVIIPSGSSEPPTEDFEAGDSRIS